MKGASGIKVREAAVDRAYTSGSMGFVERWSRKKELSRKRKQQLKREKLQNDKQRRGVS